MSLEEEDDASGSIEFRNNLAGLYSALTAGVTAHDVLTTNGGPAANYAVMFSLLNPGDHVICQHPVDESLYKIPRAIGADVTMWEAGSAQWQYDTVELKKLVNDKTKLIVLQNPCDPTGAVVPKPTLETIIEIAEEQGILIMADESYRPLFHSISPSSEDFPPSLINMGYNNVVVTGSISKAYGLRAIKAGWIASKNQDIINTCRQTRRYASLAASKLDESVAAETVSDRCIHALLGRNIRLCQTNLGLLQGFLDEHNWACSWVKPVAGTTAMVKFHKMGKPVDDEAFCLSLLEKAGLFICPASKCFGDSQKFRGYVRVAFGGPTSELKAALEAWTSYMEESYDVVPTVSSRRQA